MHRTKICSIGFCLSYAFFMFYKQILLQKYRNHNFMSEYNFETNFHWFGEFSDSYYSIEKIFT